MRSRSDIPPVRSRLRSTSTVVTSAAAAALLGTAAVGAALGVDLLGDDEPIEPRPLRAAVLEADDAARTTLVALAPADQDPAYPDVAPEEGDPGTTGEAIGYPEPEVVAAAVSAPAPAADPAPAQTTNVDWDVLAQCESGQRWDYNGASGYDGGLQFHPNTWTAYKPAGYPQYAYQATREQQIHVAEKVLDAQGWGAWPACSAKLGWR